MAGFKEQRVFLHPFGNTHPVNWIWVAARATVTRFVMLARAILKPTPKVRRIPTLYCPLGCRNVQRTIADAFDGVVNYDLIADVVRPAVGSDAEPNIVTVNKWLLPNQFSRDSDEEDEGNQRSCA
ncbi:MAG: hypothetical protein WBX22_11775 [Silvibacterium sp.]